MNMTQSGFSIPAICSLTKLAVAMSAERKEHHSAEYSFLSCSGSSTYNPWSKKKICGAAHPNFSQRHLHAVNQVLCCQTLLDLVELARGGGGGGII